MNRHLQQLLDWCKIIGVVCGLFVLIVALAECNFQLRQSCYRGSRVACALVHR